MFDEEVFEVVVKVGVWNEYSQDKHLQALYLGCIHADVGARDRCKARVRTALSTAPDLRTTSRL